MNIPDEATARDVVRMAKVIALTICVFLSGMGAMHACETPTPVIQTTDH